MEYNIHVFSIVFFDIIKYNILDFDVLIFNIVEPSIEMFNTKMHYQSCMGSLIFNT